MLEGFGLRATKPEQAPERYAKWLQELHSPPRLRPYANFAELADRLRKTNPRLKEKADFLARHWGEEKDGKVMLRADPAHKIVNATLYRYEEALACWRKVTAPVLWVEGEEWDNLKSYGPNAGQLIERRAAFPDLKHLTIPGSGHMLHHDQPEALAGAIEDFLRD
jgi:pimeloyl-ACP methyl ester carboxylesterase